jgi:HEAT repeats
MEQLYIADKSLEELEGLFACDIKDDDDFYQILAYNISQVAPDYLPRHIGAYTGSRLRGALFGLGCSPKKDDKLRDLVESFLHDPDPLIVAEAIDALRNSQNKGPWKDVAPLAQHDSPYVRGAVLRYARFVLPPEGSYPTLIAALSDDDPIVVQNALDELGELGKREARPQIRPFLKSKHSDVREAAKAALEALR